MTNKTPTTVDDMLGLIGKCPECHKNLKLTRVSVKGNITRLYGCCKRCKTSWKYSIECEEV